MAQEKELIKGWCNPPCLLSPVRGWAHAFPQSVHQCPWTMALSISSHLQLWNTTSHFSVLNQFLSNVYPIQNSTSGFQSSMDLQQSSPHPFTLINLFKPPSPPFFFPHRNLFLSFLTFWAVSQSVSIPITLPLLPFLSCHSPTYHFTEKPFSGNYWRCFIKKLDNTIHMPPVFSCWKIHVGNE